MYSNLKFTRKRKRPFFYINAVQTLDGKIQVIKNPKAYWPIGSEKDCDTMIELRAYADVLIQGKGTATWTRTLDSLGKINFQKQRLKAGKINDLLYAVVSAHPTRDLAPFLTNPPRGVKLLLITTDDAHVPPEVLDLVPLARLGMENIDFNLLPSYFLKNGYHSVLIEGGPTLWSSFFANNMIDEIFITIAPKIFGDDPGNTLSLMKDYLFQPGDSRNLQLLSVKSVKNELYLRYRIIY